LKGPYPLKLQLEDQGIKTKANKIYPIEIFEKYLWNAQMDIKRYLSLPLPVLPHAFFLRTPEKNLEGDHYCLEVAKNLGILVLEMRKCSVGTLAQLWVIGDNHWIRNVACTRCTIVDTRGKIAWKFPKLLEGDAITSDNRCLYWDRSHEKGSRILTVEGCGKSDKVQLIMSRYLTPL
jgi:hypothetical protein